VALSAQLASAAPAAPAALVPLDVQQLTGGKSLVSGQVNVIPVHLPFGFAVSLRNKSQDGRNVVIKLRVRYDRNDQRRTRTSCSGIWTRMKRSSS
jgi:hypothetical protein